MNSTIIKRRVAVIAAVSANNVIGKDGTIPWHIPEDLKSFKALTLGHTVIMGRLTHESIGKALPGRVNIVLTENLGLVSDPSVHTAPTMDDAMAHPACTPTVFLIGGTKVFQLGMDNYADTLFLTKLKTNWEGDTFFPEWDRKNWELLSVERLSSECELHRMERIK